MKDEGKRDEYDELRLIVQAARKNPAWSYGSNAEEVVILHHGARWEVQAFVGAFTPDRVERLLDEITALRQAVQDALGLAGSATKSKSVKTEGKRDEYDKREAEAHRMNITSKALDFAMLMHNHPALPTPVKQAVLVIIRESIAAERELLQRDGIIDRAGRALTTPPAPEEG